MKRSLYARELGDATPECENAKDLCGMIDMLLRDKEVLRQMCTRIIELGKEHVYDGGYRVVDLAAGGRQTAIKE